MKILVAYCSREFLCRRCLESNKIKRSVPNVLGQRLFLQIVLIYPAQQRARGVSYHHRHYKVCVLNL